MTWIEARAKELGLTQADVADRSGLNRSTINRIFNGRRSTRRSTSDKVAAALGLDPQEVADHFAHIAPPKEEDRREIPASDFSWMSDDQLREAVAMFEFRLEEARKEARGRRWNKEEIEKIGEIKQ